MRSGDPVLLRPPRGNRATVYLPLLYEWKLLERGETLRMRTSVAVKAVNVTSGWVNITPIANVLLLLGSVRARVRMYLSALVTFITVKTMRMEM